MSTAERFWELSAHFIDTSKRITYKRSRFLGKGAFARCYEIINVQNSEMLACKVMTKKLITKKSQRDKVAQEICIHRSLNHPNIVKLKSFFEDSHFIYIVLELCSKCSMSEMLRRRGTITEYECLYYMKQMLQGVKYLHDNNIIHRDLKLGNMFLNDFLHVKIGDFGLATRFEWEGQQKKTMCGTPNYIAPEILLNKSYAFEVDIWSLGCIMFTLLVGRPPFETTEVDHTYSRIKRCDYTLPEYVTPPAADMIIAMLRSDPDFRPTSTDLLKFPFIINGNNVPDSLPVSCLTLAPRFEQRGQHKVLIDVNAEQNDKLGPEVRFTLHNAAGISAPDAVQPEFQNIENLFRDLTCLLAAKPKVLNSNDEFTYPHAHCQFWITKWVDYSGKYGFGYQLSDGSIGIIFNDSTKIVQFNNRFDLHFTDVDGTKSYMTRQLYASALKKKIKLLSFFERYMTEHLIKAGEQTSQHPSDRIRGAAAAPYLHSWFRTSSAIVFNLTNGTVQFNFTDHIKIILCPNMKTVTYVDPDSRFRTFTFNTIIKQGFSRDLSKKLSYICTKFAGLLKNW